MTEAGEAVAAGKRLESWKEIALYLKRDVRTVRRWEAGEGLPVHRHVHQRLASVYAYPPELDQWLKGREHNGNGAQAVAQPRRWLWTVPVAAALLLLTGLATWRMRRPQSLTPAAAPAIRSRLFTRVAAEGLQPRWIPVGPQPTRLEVDRATGEIFVLTDTGIQAISDSANPTVREVWKGAPRTMALARDGRLLAVCTRANQIHLLTPAGQVLRTVTLQNQVQGMVFSADGEQLFLAAVWAGLKRLQVKSGELATVPTVPGNCPVSLALAPDGRRLYVDYQCGAAKGGHNDIDIIDVASEKSLGLITGLANVASAINVTPNGAQIWANAGDACSTAAYDHVGCPQAPARALNIVLADDRRLVHSFTFPMQESLTGISFTPDGSRALLGGDPLRVVDTASLVVVEQYPLFSYGPAVFNRDGSRLFVSAYEKSAVAMMELGGNGCRPAAPGMMSWWTGDGTVNDVRGGNHGALQPGAALAPGLIGQAFSFDGSGALHIAKLHNALLDLPQFTLAGWIKPAAAPRDSTVFEITDRETSLPLWRLELHPDGRPEFCEWNPEKICAPGIGAPALDAGRWHHVTAVRESDKIALFVDGQRAGDAPARVKVPSSGGRIFSLTFGGDSVGKSFFRGLLDELQLYDRPLAAAEIRSLYQAAQFGTCYQ